MYDSCSAIDTCKFIFKKCYIEGFHTLGLFFCLSDIKDGGNVKSHLMNVALCYKQRY